MHKKSNIMIAIPTLSSGGAERVASLWVNGLVELNTYDNIFLFTLYEVTNEYNVSNKVKRINLCKNESVYRSMSSTKKIKSIRNILKYNDISLVVGMVTYIGIVFNVARIGTRTKMVETIRNNPQLVPDNKKMRMLRDFSIKIAYGCIFQNNEQKKYFSTYKKKSAVIPNPVSDEFFTSNRIYRDVPCRLISLGRLHEQKNFKMLIESIEKLKDYDVCLEIYGEGSQREELQEIINKKHLSNKIKLNNSTTEVLNNLNESDIYILCSNYEGMPNVLMEAMATGIPCISTNCPTGPSDLIKNDYNGILIHTGNVDELTHAIEQYILNYKKAIEFGKRAKKDMEKYRNEVVIKRLDDFIRSLL